MNIGIFLKQPFDYLDTPQIKWFYILGSTTFAIVFLLLFQPYGISKEMINPMNSSLNKFLFFASVAFSTILGLSLSQFFLRQLFDFEFVNNKKYMYWIVIEALVLTLINFGISFIVPDLGNNFEKELHLTFQLKMFVKIFLVLLFPFVGTVLYVSIKKLSNEIQELDVQLKQYKSVYKSSNHEQVLNILDENENVDLKISINNFLYAESSNQYILVHYLKQGEVRRHIVRNRLKKFVIQSNDFPIMQCHRSYAINLLNVDYLTKKNGKEYLVIKTQNSTQHIPVSNSFLEKIQQAFS
ncbi:MAG: LytTR family transcriptional regulator [Mangrovimonas sp.]|nr:LytTR family transcriptional regulator [Mangrovimonas sp.]HRV53904.1 LytTR family DNA-binding domain-containing protein [Mangrovimonas sp.]